MLDDLLAALPTATERMRRFAGEWTILGTVPAQADIGLVRAALGPDFEVAAQPFEVHLAAGAHPWVRPRATWEIWARARSPLDPRRS